MMICDKVDSQSPSMPSGGRSQNLGEILFEEVEVEQPLEVIWGDLNWQATQIRTACGHICERLWALYSHAHNGSQAVTLHTKGDPKSDVRVCLWPQFLRQTDYKQHETRSRSEIIISKWQWRQGIAYSRACLLAWCLLAKHAEPCLSPEPLKPGVVVYANNPSTGGRTRSSRFSHSWASSRSCLNFL